IRPDCKAAASVANIFDKKIVGAEAFTAGWRGTSWSQHPYSLKPLGDAAFSMGVNRFIFHRYAMQPWIGILPGMTMGPWGIHFERTNTWWEPGSAWMRYLARCQSLLQQGRFVGDVLYFTGEGVPNYLGYRHELEPPLPDGYDFDACNADVLLNMVSVKQGRLVLPNGMEYRVLLLPNQRTMSPKLLDKIRELVEAGAVVVGPRPEHAPGLTDYPKCDQEVRAAADVLWGPAVSSDTGKAGPIDRVVGHGHVFWGLPMEEVFARLKLPPDFVCRWPESKLPCYIHRRNGQADWYFVANPLPKTIDATCGFRITGKQPEIWDPKTGLITRPAVYRQSNGRTVMPIRFEPGGSAFVVFRKSDTGGSIHTVKRDGKVILSTEDIPVARKTIPTDEKGFLTPKKITTFAENLPSHQTGKLPRIEITKEKSGVPTAVVWEPGMYTFSDSDAGKTTEIRIDELPAPLTINGTWQVSFPPGGGAPESLTLEKLISWTDDSRPGVKYFSGTATYEKTFQVPASLFAQNRRLYLYLGEVQVIAEVKLNGKELGVLWKPPFCVEVTDLLQPGKNQLEIRVTNLWPNRLIGDEQFPPDCKHGPMGLRGNIAEWPEWLLEGKPRPEPRRLTFSSWKLYDKDSPLRRSGLLGPVTIRAAVVSEIPKGR
ncbi:MAG: hypothetical protein JXM70_30910, partial [Pirellulales bacterium]|nr:hypothetical protein [Pirellulales bacterium]